MNEVAMSYQDKNLLDEFCLYGLYCEVIRNATTESRSETINCLRNVKLAVNKIKNDDTKRSEAKELIAEWQKYLDSYLFDKKANQEFSLKGVEGILEKKVKQVDELYQQIWEICKQTGNKDARQAARMILHNYVCESNAACCKDITESQKAHNQIAICDQAVILFNRMLTNLKQLPSATQKVSLHQQDVPKEKLKNSNTICNNANEMIANKILKEHGVVEEKPKPKIAKPTWHDKIFNELHDHQLGMMHHANI